MRLQEYVEKNEPMNVDEYGEIINGDKTFKAIVKQLNEGASIVIGWTDEEGTHYDVLFSLPSPYSRGVLQRGCKKTDLFVSIVGAGCFGFETGKSSHPGYYAEKLRAHSCDKLAELINTIRNSIHP